MEVVAVEGSLTDFEVLELLNSPIYRNVADYETHHANRRQIAFQTKKLEGILEPHEKSLAALQLQLNAGQISESHFRSQCSRILQKTNTTTKQLSRLRVEFAYSLRLDSTIWIKTHLLRYLNAQACRDQTREDLSKFFTALDLWQSQWYLTLEPSELTMLINLRPTTETLIQHVLNGFFDRVPQEEAREQLFNIIALLPVPPPLEYGEGGQGCLGDEDGDDDDISDDDIAAQVEAEEFDTSYGAQRDQDDDGGNDDSN